MRALWFSRLRKIHTYLSVFFSPLLLLFVFTGGWQTFVGDDDRDKGAFNAFMVKLSTIHTDSYYPGPGSAHHSSETFKYLVAAMVAGLMLSILIGLVIACQNRKNLGLVTVSFFLGILVPAAILYFS